MAISRQGMRNMKLDGVSYHYKISKIKKKSDWRKQQDELDDEFMKYARYYGLDDVREITINVVVQLADVPVSNLFIKCHSLLIDGFMGPAQILDLTQSIIVKFIKKALEEGWAPNKKGDFRAQWIHQNTKSSTPVFQQLFTENNDRNNISSKKKSDSEHLPTQPTEHEAQDRTTTKDTILKCKGFEWKGPSYLSSRLIIPSFELREGEIITLQLGNGGHFEPLEKELVTIFSGKKAIQEVSVSQKLKFAEHIKYNSLLEAFCPLTIERYCEKNAVQLPEFSPLSNAPLNPRDRVFDLDGSTRRWLSIYNALHQCNNMMFDLMGVGPDGAQTIYQYVEDFVAQNHGSALLLNNFNDMAESYNKHYKVIPMS